MSLPTRNRTALKNLVLCALMGALLFAFQMALSFLPNIEVVSVLIAVYAVVFGFWALPAVYIFVLLEGLIFGFDIWWISYLYIWLILFAAAYLLKKADSAVVWALVLAIFGLFFGALSALPTAIAGGVSAAVSWWINGIVFDIIHCASNFVMGLVLFKPLKNALLKIRASIYKG